MRGVVMFCAILIGFLSLAGRADGEPDKPKNANAAIPFGSGWHCFENRSKWNPRDRAGRCFRDRDVCNARQQEIADEGNEYESEVTPCRAQAKAAVVTYFDVMQDRWIAWPVPSSELCNETRAFLARSRDHRNISACQLVGDRFPSPARFRPDAVQPGETWHCNRKGYCTRDPDKCIEWDADSTRPELDSNTLEEGTRGCVRQSRVAVLTARSASGSFAALAFSSTEICQAARASLALSVDELSSCTTVGATQRPPVDRSLIPKGTGWFCYELSADAGPSGFCARTEEECESQRELDAIDNHKVTACRATKAVVGRTDDGEFFAYPTKRICESRMTTRLTSSRCEPAR